MAKFQGAIVVDRKEVNGKGYHFAILVNEETCVGCASCGHICPDGVITVYRAKVE